MWRAFEAAVADVRAAMAALPRDRHEVRFAADYGELGGMTAANVLWLRVASGGRRPVRAGRRRRPGAVGAGRPARRSTSCLRVPGHVVAPRPRGRRDPAAGADLRQRRPRRRAPRPRRCGTGISSAAGALKPGGWCASSSRAPIPTACWPPRSRAPPPGSSSSTSSIASPPRSGDGVVLHLRKPSAEDRLRHAVAPSPLRLGVEGGHLTYPELAPAIERAAVGLLRDRGEPAGLTRIVAAVVAELGSLRVLLRRVAVARAAEARGPARTGSSGGGPQLIAIAASARSCGATTIRAWSASATRRGRSGGCATRSWPSGRWPTGSSGRRGRSCRPPAGSTRPGFFDRIYRPLSRASQAPDEELVRACLAAYAAPGELARSRTERRPRQAHGGPRPGASPRSSTTRHRLGLRAWIAAREHDRIVRRARLAERLADDERRVYLPLVIRAPTDALGAGRRPLVRARSAGVPVRGRVDGHGRRGHPATGAGRSRSGEQQARFLVIPAERAELLRLKMQRSPWLRDELDRQNWHVLKWQHLDTLADAGRRAHGMAGAGARASIRSSSAEASSSRCSGSERRLLARRATA